MSSFLARSIKKPDENQANQASKFFIEFLEILNLFDHKSRKPYKQTNLQFQSIYDFLQPYLTSYEEFNRELFKNIYPALSPYDYNNLMIIRAIVEGNHEILLRMFNEVPLFISRKLNLHHTSQRYYSFKILFLLSSLGKQSVSINQNILKFLTNQLDQKDEIIKNITGLDYHFFNLLCASDDGDFSKFISYLASKDDKYLILTSLYCWFYAPFLSHLYTISQQKENLEKRVDISLLLMYGIFNVLHIFFKANQKDLLSYKVIIKMKEILKEKIIIIFSNVCRECENRPIFHIDWFSFEISKMMDGINQDFMKFLKDYCKNQKEIINELFDEIRHLFANDLIEILNKFFSFFETKVTNNKNMIYPKLLINFFMPYFYGASGLASSSNEIIDSLLKETLYDENINNHLTIFLENHFYISEKKEKSQSPHKIKKDRNKLLPIYTGIIQLSMVGFHIIEKSKKYKPSNTEKFLSEILKKM